MSMNLSDKILFSILNDEINQKLLSFLSNCSGIELYIVGGYLRDAMLGVPTDDRDYVVLGTTGILFAEKISNFLDGHFIILDEENDTARVVLPDRKNYLDITGCVGKNIIEDLSRRDFTLNAMAFKLENNNLATIIDPYNGQQDLLNKIITAISEANIIEDPLRVLRAFRIASQLSGEIDYKTAYIMTKHYKLLDNVAMERIQTELSKLLSHKESFNYIKQLSDLGILTFLIPELTKLTPVPPNVYHHLGLYEHTLEVYRQIELLFSELSDKTIEHLCSYLSPSIQRITTLKYAALLHDIAKPQTWVIDEDGKHTFIGHADQGSLIAEEIAKRLKLPNVVIKAIKKLVKYHLYPSQISNNLEMPSQKATLRLFRKLETETPETIVLAIADRKSALGPLINAEFLTNQVNMLLQLLEAYYSHLEVVDTLPKLLDGFDIMRLLNLKPSRQVGEVLSALKNLQIEGEINTVEEATNWLTETYKC